MIEVCISHSRFDSRVLEAAMDGRLVIHLNFMPTKMEIGPSGETRILGIEPLALTAKILADRVGDGGISFEQARAFVDASMALADSDGTEYERIAPGVFMAKPDPKADHGK